MNALRSVASWLTGSFGNTGNSETPEKTDATDSPVNVCSVQAQKPQIGSYQPCPYVANSGPAGTELVNRTVYPTAPQMRIFMKSGLIGHAFFEISDGEALVSVGSSNNLPDFYYDYLADTPYSILASFALSIWGTKITIEDHQNYFKKLDDNPNVASVVFPLNKEQATTIMDKVLEEFDSCREQDDQQYCQYKLFSQNCVDYTQRQFGKTDYSGHYIDYFPREVIDQTPSLAMLYAQLRGENFINFTSSDNSEIATARSSLGNKAAGVLAGGLVLRGIHGWLNPAPKVKLVDEPVDKESLANDIADLIKGCEKIERTLDGKAFIRVVPFEERKHLTDNCVDIQIAAYDLQSKFTSKSASLKQRQIMKAEYIDLMEQLKALVSQVKKTYDKWRPTSDN